MKGYFQKIRFFFNKERLPSAEELLFQEDRKRLLGTLREMGDAVSTALKLVMEALEERNPEKAARVIAEDARIDDLEMELEQQCLHVTALRRPVRNDLRFLVSLIKVAGDLERTGDQAANIAEKAILLGKAPLLKPLRDIPKMGSLTREMTDYALKSFEAGDAHL
ncbi:MAG TPA: PhoU domain-containing protein, partial [Synergistaceae bacterium]|nr:PhoU domain-containing protein [Synergistaceae bacterium]